MKKLFFILLLLIIATNGSSWAAVNLPTANITGDAATSATNFTLENAFISRIDYLDGTACSTSSPCGSDESLLNAEVVISGASRTGDYTFTDARIEVIAIDGSGFKYLSADLSDVVFVTDGFQWYLNPGLDVNNPSTLNMSNVALLTDGSHPSRYILELDSVKGLNSNIGMTLTLSITSGNPVEDIKGDSTANVSYGLIDGTPELIEPPSGVRTIGYWKNHDQERDAFIGDAECVGGACSICSATFPTPDALRVSLMKKGKKYWVDKTKQQLAALCLNLASSLDPTTLLREDECSILTMVNGATCLGPTVDDARAAIETAISNVSGNGTAGELEDAKDLADEINNRDHNN